jgi:hypothetical protein
MDDSNVLYEIKNFLKTTLWITPTNLPQERERFLAGKVENPLFEYPTYPKEKLWQYLKKISNIPCRTNDQIAVYLHQRQLEELSLRIQLIISRDTPEYSAITQKLYLCRFPEDILNQAKEDSNSIDKFEAQEKANPTEIVDTIKNYLNSYGINDWQVVLTEETAFYFRVKASKKTILVSKNVNWDFCDLDNTLAHEIDGHVVRAINASKQTNSLLQKPLPFYIKTEEGLASFLGDYFSTTTTISRKHHALKYLAGNVAISSSFREVFEFLVNSGFTPELAFQRTFKLKRGMSDTSKPGLYAKEAVYYEGMREVKNFLDSGGDLEHLYSGKFGLDDLTKITRDIPDGIIIPNRLKSSSYSKSK